MGTNTAQALLHVWSVQHMYHSTAWRSRDHRRLSSPILAATVRTSASHSTFNMIICTIDQQRRIVASLGQGRIVASRVRAA
jgi:hypothetical protein